MPSLGVGEGIDRSLIRRAMLGLLLEIVLTNRRGGLQASDWYEKPASQRGEVTRYFAEYSESTLAWRAADCCAGTQR